MKIGVVVADFNKDMTHVMLQLVSDKAKGDHHEVVVAHVAGVYDMPVVVKKLLEQVDGVITLGVVLQGGTDHDLTVANNAAQKFVDLSCDSGKPVACGVIGPRVSREKALERVESYALHSYDALVQSLNTLRGL
jgi:6,7-dimethyl-8-ribityllumazine synthase